MPSAIYVTMYMKIGRTPIGGKRKNIAEILIMDDYKGASPTNRTTVYVVERVDNAGV